MDSFTFAQNNIINFISTSCTCTLYMYMKYQGVSIHAYLDYFSSVRTTDVIMYMYKLG